METASICPPNRNWALSEPGSVPGGGSVIMHTCSVALETLRLMWGRSK